MLNDIGGRTPRTQHALILLVLWGCSKNSDLGTATDGGASSTGGALAAAGASVGGTSAFGGSGSAAGQGGTASSSGGMANSSAGMPNTGTACGALQLQRNVTVADMATDRVTWNDARCLPRSAALTRVGGGYVRQ